MTKEEKAKAYDEAIKKAKEIKEKIVYSHLSTESCKAVSEYIDTIIPELRESKDERIRKWLIKQLSAIVNTQKAKSLDEEGYEMSIKAIAWLEKQKECFATISNTSASEDERIRKGLIEALKTSKTVGELKFVIPEPTREECLAYLEKQKDASYAIEAVDRIDKYIDEHLANAHDMKDSNPDKKYYRGWDDALGKMAGILQDVYSLEKQKEQPKEELVYRLNGLMQDYIKEGKDDEEKEHRFKCYKLFWDALEDASYFEQKEQKPWKVGANAYFTPEQKPAEWSEEDEDMLNSCISSIEEAKENRYAYKETDGDTSYDHEIAWLKLLRPSWKPSEEQLVTLLRAEGIVRVHDTKELAADLARLYEQMKAIKEDKK